MKTPVVLGISGSIRSQDKHFKELYQLILRADSSGTLLASMQDSGIVFANSDIALACSLLGARQAGADIKLISIKKIAKTVSQSYSSKYSKSANPSLFPVGDATIESMLDKVRNATGVVLASPVYFGDRSSVANKFLQLANHHGVLAGKVFGAVAVGAKRNGGQETTLIYCLVDALAQGAFAVGNGPATCQYGGTLVAGEANTVYGDTWGITRALELGNRVGQVSSLIAWGQARSQKRRLNIQVLMAMDRPDKKFRQVAEKYFAPVSKKHEVEFHDLIDHPIARCHACDVCPYAGKTKPGEEYAYNCKVRSKTDCAFLLNKAMMNADALVIVGINTADDVIYRYQAFTERTRYLRRDNFQLTNIPVIGMLIEELGGTNNPLHQLKVVTSYIRHNTILISPIKITMKDDRIVHQTEQGRILEQLEIVRSGRDLSQGQAVSYKAEGYAIKKQETIASVRK
jgi:multimeric flavodoxin WrbA